MQVNELEYTLVFIFLNIKKKFPTVLLLYPFSMGTRHPLHIIL